MIDTIICGVVPDALYPIADETFQTCITSPPYWGLRDYGLEPAVWDGDPECEHEWNSTTRCPTKIGSQGSTEYGKYPRLVEEMATPKPGSFCHKCNAWLGCLGLEPSPELYVDHLVQIFREVKRVLRKDGTLWLNIGDSYAGPWGSHKEHHKVALEYKVGKGAPQYGKEDGWCPQATPYKYGLKPKDMVLIPFRLALALQEPYETHVIKDEKWRMWLAAVIDTDGCIGVRKQASSGKKGRDWNDTYIPYLAVSMSDTQIIEQCIKLTGYGKINTKQRAGTTDNRGINSRHDYYTWRLDGDKAVKLLRDIGPYLLIKQRQAIVICSIDDSNKSGRTGWNTKVPVKEMEKRHSLYELVKSLNQREQVDFPSWIQKPKIHIEPGWWVRSDIAWHKPNCMPSSVKDRPTTDFEHVFLLAKNKRYYYDQDAIREPISNSSRERWGDKVHERHGSPDVWHKAEKHSGEAGCGSNPAGRNKRTVWTIPTKSYPEAHFATFPPDLIEPMILAGSAEGDMVLDPFAGSGTTCAVAKAHGRHWIGIEANEKYCELARKRIRQEQSQLKLDLLP
jgi:DNA modification methylase